MTILIVSEKEKESARLSDLLSELNSGHGLLCCQTSPEALAAARTQTVDVAFIDIELSELSALDLGQYMKELNPYVNLIFMIEEKSCAYDAFHLRASGCILMPYSAEQVREELRELRYPQSGQRPKRAFAQTFGNFEFFVDGSPVSFKYSKTKEVLALLINNRGAQTTNGEIIASLWEDDGDPDKKGSYLRNLRQDLNNTLTKLQLNDLIVKQRGSMAIVTDRIECDLFDWMEKRQESRYHYLGDYMNQYSWAEYLHAELDEISWSFA